LFSPRSVFLYPGVILLVLASLLSLLLLPGPISIAPHISLDVHSLIVGAMTTLIGLQCISFAIVARRYAAVRGFLPYSSAVERWLTPLTLERILLVSLVLGLAGIGGFVWCIAQWASLGFGPLEYASLVR